MPLQIGLPPKMICDVPARIVFQGRSTGNRGTFDAQRTCQGLHHVGRRVDVDDLFWAVADAHTHTDLLVLVATAAGISSLQIGQE